LNKGPKGPLKYAQIVHCDKNKNIYVSNKKSTDVTVYNDGWELQDKEYIDRVRDNGMNKFIDLMASENAENIKINISKDIRKLFYNNRPANNKKNKMKLFVRAYQICIHQI